MPKNNIDAVIVTTGKVRICYANLWEPKMDDTTKKLKYSCTVLIPKTDLDTQLKIKEAVEAAYQAGQNDLKGNNRNAPALGSIHTPLHDGDEERPDDPVFAGCMYLNATSLYAPDIYDINKAFITDHDEVYSGCYGRVGLKFFVYTTGGKGIGAGLMAFQKLEDGENLSSKFNTADLF